MKATRNFYHINIDDTENWEVTTPGGLKLFFDPEFDTVNNIIQYGKVINPPIAISKQVNMTTPEAGDTIYFHHQVFGNKVEFEEEYFRWATHDQLYFIIRKDNIIMLNNFVLVKPIEVQDKTTSGIFLESTSHKVEQRGILKAIPGYAEGDFVIDDEVVFTKNSNLMIKIGEEEFYIMDINDIMGIVMKDGDKENIAPVGQWTFVEPLDEGGEYENVNGILVHSKIKKEDRHRGLVYKTFDTMLGIKDGDKVIYDRRSFYAFKENDTKYYAVNALRDIFILL